jgi:hypothetical protein
MMRASYTPNSDLASATLDQIARWMRQHPERTGVYAFMAARMMEREALPYRATFDRVMRAGIAAGLSERLARTRVFHGFAAAAAGHIEPPPELEDGGV